MIRYPLVLSDGITSELQQGDTIPLTAVNTLQENLDTIVEAIANLSSAQGSISNSTTPVFSITTTPQVVPFTVTQDSTDPTVFSFSDTNNTVTFLHDTNYNFTSSVTLTANTGNARTITFRLIDIATGLQVTSQAVTINIQNGATETLPLNTLITVGSNGVPAAPLTVRIEAVADNTGYTFTSFSSILAGNVTTSGGGAGSTIDDTSTTLLTTWSSSKISSELGGKANSSHTHAISDVTDLQTTLDSKVTTNTAIAAGTGTKITYDSKGLVTGSTTLAATDIPELDATKITSGTLTVDTSGNAATATKLETARTIAGTSFDGSANIDISYTGLTDKPKRYLNAILSDASTAITNTTGYVTPVELPVSGTITSIRARTATGTVVTQFKLNGSPLGTAISTTSSGVSQTVSQYGAAGSLVTIDTSSASGNGLTISVEIN